MSFFQQVVRGTMVAVWIRVKRNTFLYGWCRFGLYLYLPNIHFAGHTLKKDKYKITYFVPSEPALSDLTTRTISCQATNCTAFWLCMSHSDVYEQLPVTPWPPPTTQHKENVFEINSSISIRVQKMGPQSANDLLKQVAAGADGW